MQTFEGFYGASAGRNGLVALVPFPSSSWTVTGTNWVEPTMKARVLRAITTISNTIANVVESALEASHDKNVVRWQGARDQTALQEDVLKQNYSLVNPANNTTSIARVLENNGNAAEICNVHAVLASDDDSGITTAPPVLPPNVRAVSFTATITSVLGNWVAGTPTLNFTFNPKSRYAIYGGSAWGATMTGLRFSPKAGSEPADLYPGFPAADTNALAKVWYQANGRPMLTFDGANPPDIAVAAVTAAAQTPTGFLLIGEV